MAPGSRFDREASSGEDRYYHLILLAENNQGYQKPDEDRLERICRWILLQTTCGFRDFKTVP